MANFAGFLVENVLVVLGLDPDAEDAVIDIADEGRINGIGEVPPGFGEDGDSEEGCCRTAKTKVLLTARR